MKKGELRVWFAFALLSFLLIFLLIYLLPSSNYAAKKSTVAGFAAYELTQCTNSFNTGYGYYLSSDIAFQTTQNCFYISVPDVEINCQGFSITNYDANAIGIFSQATNTTIRNCIIRTNTSSGIGIQFSAGASQGAIINNTLDKNARGISIYSEGNNITKNTFIDNAIPMQIRSEPDNTIYNNIIIDKKIRECKNISTKGTYTLSSNILANNSRQICLNITSPNVEINCKGFSIGNNNTDAIAISSNSLNTTIRNCIIETNTSSGIGIRFNAQASMGFITNNTIKNNQKGLYINSNANLISDNVLFNNARNILIESGTINNLLKNNNFGSSPKVYFKFDEYNNNDNFIDSASPNGLGGTPIPNKTNGPKKIGNPDAPGDYYALFNGNNYINVSEFRQSISPNSPITVMFWAQADNSNIGKKAAIFSVDVDSLNNPRQFAAYLPWEDSKIYWDYGNMSFKGRIKYDYKNYFGNMAHITLVSGGINGNFKAIYINGELAQSESNSSGPDNNFGKLIIGCIPNYKTGSSISAYCYKGAIDDFMIYDRIVESEEIQQIYTSQKNKFNGNRFYDNHSSLSENDSENIDSQTIEITTNELRAGKSVSLKVGDEIQLIVADEYYYLILDSLTSSKARFFVDYDEEINFTIDLNKTAKFDFDADDIYDLSIKFSNISSNRIRASFFLKSISEPITSGSSGNARNAGGNSRNNNGAGGGEESDVTYEEESTNSNLTNLNNATSSDGKKALPSYLFVLVMASFIVLIIILIIWIYLEITKGKESDVSETAISFSKYNNSKNPSFRNF